MVAEENDSVAMPKCEAARYPYSCRLLLFHCHTYFPLLCLRCMMMNVMDMEADLANPSLEQNIPEGGGISLC